MEKILTTYVKFIIFAVYVVCALYLPNELFRDRDNYVSYARSYNLIYDNYIEYGFNVFVNEPLFLLINHALSWLNPELVPYVFVFFIISTFFCYLSKQSVNIVTFMLGVALFFVVSYTFHYQFVVLRQAVATSIFMITLFHFRTYKSIFIVSLICAFIHSSFFLVATVVAVSFLLRNYSRFLSTLLQLFIYLFVGGIALSLAALLGVRQVSGLLELEYAVGGGSFLVWLIVFCYLLFYGCKENILLYNISIAFLVLFLSLYFFNPVVGRLMCSIVPFVILLLVKRGKLSDLFIMCFVLFAYAYLMMQGVLFNLSFAVDSETFFREMRRISIF